MVQKILDRVFTFASSEDDGDGAPHLLFVSRNRDETILSYETMDAIVMDPLFKELMGDTEVMLARMDDHYEYPVLLATHDVEEHAIPLLGHSNEDETVILFQKDNNGELRRQNLDIYKLYYQCTRPHKTVVGCCDCVDKSDDNPRDCVLKRIVSKQQEQDFVPFTPERLKTRLRSKQDKIAGFTYVSPKLTGTKHFAKYYRDEYDHDFDVIEQKSDIVAAGLKERARFNRFKKSACPECFMQEWCHGNYTYDGAWRIRRCSGAYPKTEEAAYDEILETATIPYTKNQIAYLLNRSGPLEKRYNRCKYAATFGMLTDGTRELQFGLRRKTKPWKFTPFDSFQYAKTFMDEYGDPHYHQVKPGNITKRAQALLVETAAIQESPRYNSWAFGGATYLPFYIFPHTYRELYFDLNYVNGSGRHVYRHTEVQALSRIYHEKGRFKCLAKTPHNERRYHYW